MEGVALNAPTILQVNYYDDYSFMGRNGIPDISDPTFGYEAAAESEGFGRRYTESYKGLITGTLTAQLDSSPTTYLCSVMYYDSYGRLIQSKAANQLPGGVEKQYMAYNFVGQPIKRKHIYAATGKTTQVELYNV